MITLKTVWVLLVFASSNPYQNSGAAMTSQTITFHTRESCEAARQLIPAPPKGYVSSVCLEVPGK